MAANVSSLLQLPFYYTFADIQKSIRRLAASVHPRFDTLLPCMFQLFKAKNGVIQTMNMRVCSFPRAQRFSLESGLYIMTRTRTLIPTPSIRTATWIIQSLLMTIRLETTTNEIRTPLQRLVFETDGYSVITSLRLRWRPSYLSRYASCRAEYVAYYRKASVGI